MIISADCFLLTFFVTAAVLTAENHWSDFIVSIILCWIAMAIAILFFFPLLTLTLFHFYLISKNVTTFEFIMSKRAEEKASDRDKVNI